MKVVNVGLSYEHGGKIQTMKRLEKPGKLVPLGKPSKVGSSQEEVNEKPIQKTNSNSEKNKSKNTPVNSEKTEVDKSNQNSEMSEAAESVEVEIKEETTAMTVEYPDRHMDYIYGRIAKKLLDGGGKSRKNRRKSRSDFSKEVREIIDEAIERDNK